MSSFLDNSGDIILDAVLTDIGRQRLARADEVQITNFKRKKSNFVLTSCKIKLEEFFIRISGVSLCQSF